MLTFEDDFVTPSAQPRLHPSTPDTIRAHAVGNIAGGILSREPVHDLDAESQAALLTILEGHLDQGGLAIAATHVPIKISGARALELKP